MLLAYINSKCILTLKKSIEVSKMLKSMKIQGPRKFSCSTISEKLVMDTNITVSRSFNNKHVHKISTFLPSTKTAPCKAKPDFCVQKLKMAQLHTTCKNEYWLDAKRREPSTLPDRYPGRAVLHFTSRLGKMVQSRILLLEHKYPPLFFSYPCHCMGL